MKPEEIILSGLLELYCMGLCSPAESNQVKAWAEQYPVVASEIDSIQSALESYTRAQAVQPAESVKEKLFSHIREQQKNLVFDNKVSDSVVLKNIPVRSITSRWRWTSAAATVLFIVSAAMGVFYYNKYTVTNNDLASVRKELEDERTKSSDMKHDMDIVHNPYSMPVVVKGMEQMPDATAKIFWMQNTGEVMIDASNLPDVPPGKQYQFWAIVDGTPVDGGMIITNDKGIKFRMQKMKAFGRAQAFAISLEKAGGNPKPTTVVSMGKI